MRHNWWMKLEFIRCLNKTVVSHGNSIITKWMRQANCFVNSIFVFRIHHTDSSAIWWMHSALKSSRFAVDFRRHRETVSTRKNGVIQLSLFTLLGPFGLNYELTHLCNSLLAVSKTKCSLIDVDVEHSHHICGNRYIVIFGGEHDLLSAHADESKAAEAFCLEGEEPNRRIWATSRPRVPVCTAISDDNLGRYIWLWFV